MKNKHQTCVQCSGSLSKNNYSGICQNCKNENARNAKNFCVLCKEKPRKVYSSGLISSYCAECKKQVANHSRSKCLACNKFIPNSSTVEYCPECYSKNIVKEDKICRVCRQRKRHISSSGKMLSYCTVCISDFEKNRRKLPAIKYYKLKISWQERGIITIPTKEQYEKMLQEANGICPACGREPINKKVGLVLHHNHTTGEWIGLLCAHCNATLGYMDEDVELLERLYNYAVRMGH